MEMEASRAFGMVRPRQGSGRLRGLLIQAMMGEWCCGYSHEDSLPAGSFNSDAENGCLSYKGLKVRVSDCWYSLLSRAGN